MISTVIKMLEKTSKKYPDRTAVTTAKAKVSFKTYQESAQCIGTALISAANIWNHPVAVFLPKSEKALFAIMGVLYSGNYYVPVDYDSPEERLERILDQLHHPFVITDPEGAARISGYVDENKVLDVDQMLQSAIDRPALEQAYGQIIDTDPVYIIFTSGSTGDPKGVVVPHRAVIDFIEWWKDQFGLNEDTVFANQAPFYFDLSMPDIYTPLFTGGRTHLLDPSLFMNPVALVKEINAFGINALNWSPSAMMMLSYMKVFKKASFDNMKFVMFIGEPMPVKHLNYWRENNPSTTFVNLYGPTETAYASTYYVVDRAFAEGDILPIGQACGNERVFLLGEDGHLIREKNEIGEICITGSCLAKGYYGMDHPAFSVMPGQTDYNDRIYHTGDLGRYNDRGELECLGRKDSQIKHMGYRIELGEVESAVSAVRGIRNACVLYHREKSDIVLFYEADENVDRQFILQETRKLLPAYMQPTRFVRFDHMPLNQNGKTDRAGLRNKFFS